LQAFGKQSQAIQPALNGFFTEHIFTVEAVSQMNALLQAALRHWPRTTC